MKKTVSIFLTMILCLGLFSGCKLGLPDAISSATKEEDFNIISPLPESIDINNLDNCIVAVSLGKGDAYVDESGKMVMKVMAYTYDLYDLADVSSLEEKDVIVRLGEEVEITDIERLDTGVVRINGGEEKGGFDLASDDSTVYYEKGMDDTKAYRELGEVTLPVSDEFEYIDESEADAEAKCYYPGDFLTEDAGIEYDFSPNNTSIVIENGVIIKLNKVYNP